MLPVLHETLKDPSGQIRVQSADFLWQLDPDPKVVVPVLVEALKDPSSSLLAINVLARLADKAPEAIPALGELVKSGQFGHRLQAARALAQFGPQARPAVPQLVDTLKDANPTLRLEAAKALNRIGEEHKAAAEALVEALSTQPQGQRSLYFAALAEFGPRAKDVVGRLQPLLKDADRLTRLQTAETLCLIDRGQVEGVRSLLLDEIRPRDYHATLAAGVLCRHDPQDKEGRDFLLSRLQDSQGINRANAALFLGKCGPAAKVAVPRLTEMLKDNYASARVQAALALWRIDRYKDAIPLLIEMLEVPEFGARYPAVTALGEIGPAAKAAIPALLQAREDPQLRFAANTALGKIDPKISSTLP
jgi:HEAT repeat protein